MPGTKKITRLTLASLAINAGLIVFLLIANRPHAASGNSRPIPTRETDRRGSDTLQRAARPPPVSTGGASVMDWKERLRQNDIPRHVLIAAIQADLRATWAKKENDLRKQYTDGIIDIQDLALFGVDCEIELETSLREALGEEAFRGWDRHRKLFNIDTAALTLSNDQANKLHSIRTAVTDRLRALERSQIKKEINPTTYRERYELAQAEYEQALKYLLGSQRFNEARDPAIPADLHRDLRGLGLSEAQLTQIKDIESSFSEGRENLQRDASSGLIDSVKLDQEQETLTNFRDAQLQQILGGESYALYRRQQDPRYQTMTDFAKNWQLTQQDVDNVFKLLHANETETRRIKLADYAGGIPPKETEKKISALQAKVNESLRQTLTPAQAEKLKRNGIIPP